MALNPRPDSELERLCVRVRRADANALRKVSETTGVGFNELFRQIIHNYVTNVFDRERKALDQKDLTTHRLDLDGLDDLLEEENA